MNALPQSLTTSGVLAEGATELVEEIAWLSIDAEDRRQVNVHADAGQVLPGRGSGLARGAHRVRRLADLLGRLVRRAGQPPHLSTLLIGHQQQRSVDRTLLLRLFAAAQRPMRSALAGDVFAEEDDTRRLTGPDLLQQRIGHVSPA